MNKPAIYYPLTRLPNFRGKIRVLRMLHNLLGFGGKHVEVDARLTRPVSYRMLLDLHSKHELMAYLMSEYEADATRFLVSVYDQNGYFLDVGANIGLISIPFAFMTEAARPAPAHAPMPIYCVEPIRSNYDSLCRNVSRNGLNDRIRILCFGLGEEQKRVDIQVEDNLKDGAGTGTANILAEGSDYECERIPLQITTIDDLVASAQLPPHCSLIKLDTDGYDLFVLKGAVKMLAGARPVIFGEFMAHCLRWHGQTIDDVRRFMESLGYVVFFKRIREWRFDREMPMADFVSDLLLLPDERVHEFRWCCEG
jgi:FkbM family methyltransferase